MTQATFDPSSYDVAYVLFAVEGGESYDSKDDWSLLRAHVEVGDPQLRRFEVTIPGRDGVLDLSEALGGAYYGNREISARFICLNWIEERFHLLASTIRNAIEGRVCRITFSDDLGFFWRGRPQVEATWRKNGTSEIVITATVDPFKWNSTSSYEPWLWDSFNFVTGVVTQQSDISLSGDTETVTLPRDPARGKPTLWLNSGNARAKLSNQSAWQVLKAGANLFPEIRMSDSGEVALQLNGTGSVGVEYRVGSL